MIEFIIILSLIGFNAWNLWRYDRQQKMLIEALMSRDVNEFVSAQLSQRPVKKQKNNDSDMVPLADMSDEEFSKLIKKQIKG